ncbi:unnamed protein product [Parascedosporium putredinis]|uniref:Thioesterase domain-containing protein n=1 Tax=Parascedosporium putredinis TaxID=1442378 RepID=A0A9P1GW36_9PEZI|nr:unnamed protein product [Parascedosporium putredinis]CAI7988410.1 unnamed protein product [Parascedosporium putredinis]
MAKKNYYENMTQDTKAWVEGLFSSDPEGRIKAWISPHVDPSSPIANVRTSHLSLLGVSRTLNVTYLRPVPVGSTVRVVCEIVHVGRRMATIKATMTRESDGAVLAICEHGKVSTDADASSKA